MASLDLTQELGPQFIVTAPAEQLTLEVGVKSSSLFGSGGNSAGGEGIEVVTAIPVGAYRAVTHTGFYADSTLIDLSNYAGVTLTAAIAGEVIEVKRTGKIVENTWTWTPNAPVFISANGILTQTPPVLPIRRIGWAISGTQINLDPFPIIGV